MYTNALNNEKAKKLKAWSQISDTTKMIAVRRNDEAVSFGRIEFSAVYMVLDKIAKYTCSAKHQAAMQTFPDLAKIIKNIYLALCLPCFLRANALFKGVSTAIHTGLLQSTVDKHIISKTSLVPPTTATSLTLDTVLPQVSADCLLTLIFTKACGDFIAEIYRRLLNSNHFTNWQSCLGTELLIRLLSDTFPVAEIIPSYVWERHSWETVLDLPFQQSICVFTIPAIIITEVCAQIAPVTVRRCSHLAAGMSHCV